MLNIKIQNNTNIISDQEIRACLELLPKEYKNLNSKINIYESDREYLIYCLRKLDFISLISKAMDLGAEKLFKIYIYGFYNLRDKDIYIFCHKIYDTIDSCLNKINNTKGYEEHKELVTKEVLLEHREMWVKYHIVNILIHELTHALQDKEKRLNRSVLKKIFTRWKNREEEIEAMNAMIKFTDIYEEKFLEILNARGIKANHSSQELGYKYKIHISKK